MISKIYFILLVNNALIFCFGGMFCAFAFYYSFYKRFMFQLQFQNLPNIYVCNYVCIENMFILNKKK